MAVLRCDIQMGGSTTQYLAWHLRNSSDEAFIASLILSIRHRAKTKPQLQARRVGSLMGIALTYFKDEPRVLNCLCIAVNDLKVVEGG